MVGLLRLVIFAATMVSGGTTLAQGDGFRQAVKFHGKRLECIRPDGQPAPIKLKSPVASPGAEQGGRLFFNIPLLREFSPEVGWFIFYHECGHTYAGDSETEADNYAVYRAFMDGWLNDQTLRAICDSFGNGPAHGPYPAGQERCQNVLGYYDTLLLASRR